MNPLRRLRLRLAIVLVLLASLGAGLVTPVLAARTSGTASIYSLWLGDNLGDRADQRTQQVIGRMANAGYFTLRDYVQGFVDGLVADQGLAEAARILRIDTPSSSADLARAFLAGLRSLSPASLPEAALLPGSDGRALPLDRPVPVAHTAAGSRPEPAVEGAQVGNPSDFTSPAETPGSSGVQPRGP